MIPETKDARMKLASYLSQVVEHTKIVDESKDEISNLLSIAKEEFDIPTTDLKDMVRVLLNQDKVISEIEKRTDAIKNTANVFDPTEQGEE